MPGNEDFLRDYFKDSQEDMRWRRNVEFRLLQFLLVFYTIIGAAMATLYESSIDQTAYLLLSIGATIFILLTSLFITEKICAEHKIYADIGQAIKKIWSYFGLFEQGAYLENDTILPKTLLDPKKGYGLGSGYIRTLLIVWTITAAMIAMILALGILKNP